MKQVLAEVIENREVASGLYLVWLEAAGIAGGAKAGQFVMVWCGEGNELVLRRPISIHRTDQGKGRLALLFQVVGQGTGWLAQRRAGEKIDLIGPLGNGFSVQPATGNLLLVAGGIGLAPLCLLAERALRQGCSVTLLYGTAGKERYPEALLPAGLKLVAATEDGTVGQRGMVTELLPDYADRADRVFACGPLPMFKDMYLYREKLLGGKPVQVSLEVRMGCGRGLCYGCTVKTKDGLKLVCQDGPVFNLADIVWDELGW